MLRTMIGYPVTAPEKTSVAERELQIVDAQLSDANAVITLFSALHSFNASLDAHFTLADGWENLLCREFTETLDRPDHLWLLVKDGNRAVGLLIAAVHTDSPIFRHRQWIEVEALYVAPSHRSMGIAQSLLNQVYEWADTKQLPRVQLYVTASNIRAQSLYTDQGFTLTQAIMRRSVG